MEKSIESFLVKMMMRVELNEEYEQIANEIRNIQVSNEKISSSYFF